MLALRVSKSSFQTISNRQIVGEKILTPLISCAIFSGRSDHDVSKISRICNYHFGQKKDFRNNRSYDFFNAWANLNFLLSSHYQHFKDGACERAGVTIQSRPGGGVGIIKLACNCNPHLRILRTGSRKSNLILIKTIFKGLTGPIVLLLSVATS